MDRLGLHMRRAPYAAVAVKEADTEMGHHPQGVSWG